MKNFKISIIVVLSVFLFSAELFSQETTIVTPSNEVGENLDLYAVMEVFKESESVEAFEKALNDPDKELNNLDLNGDGEIDYIRVVEEGEGDARVFVLQAVVGEDLFQDVATIEVEKKDDEEWVAQAIGAEDVYGPDYIVEPAPTTVVRVYTWPIIVFAWHPHYVHWHSPYYWHHYPPYYRPRPPFPPHVYRGHVSVYHRRATFHHTTVRRTVHTQNIYRTQRGQHKSNIGRTKPATTQKQPKATRNTNTKNVNKNANKNVNKNASKATKNKSANRVPKDANKNVKKSTSKTKTKAAKPANKNVKPKSGTSAKKRSTSINTPSAKRPSSVKTNKRPPTSMKKTGKTSRPTNRARSTGKRPATRARRK